MCCSLHSGVGEANQTGKACRPGDAMADQCNIYWMSCDTWIILRERKGLWLHRTGQERLQKTYRLKWVFLTGKFSVQEPLQTSSLENKYLNWETKLKSERAARHSGQRLSHGNELCIQQNYATGRTRRLQSPKTQLETSLATRSVKVVQSPPFSIILHPEKQICTMDSTWQWSKTKRTLFKKIKK